MPINKLEDIINNRTKILFCGMAAGKKSCKMSHYYADKGNKFWKVLKEANFLDVLIEPSEKREKRESNYSILKDYGIGLTDLIKDQSGMDKEVLVKEKDIKRLQKVIKNNLKNLTFLVFNGKKSAAAFLRMKPKKLEFGYQNKKDKEFGVDIYILPSTSGVNTNFDLKYWKYFSKIIEKNKLKHEKLI